MYAAAGGASLASRQARQRQRQQKKSQQLQAKLHPPKAPCVSVAEHGASTPTRHSRQFHQLPNNYLRTPQAQVRKLSASYTAQSKLLLPIDEGDTQSVLHMRVHPHGHGHGHGHSHHAHSHSHQEHHQHMVPYTGQHHGRVSPKLVHRHSGSSGTSFHHSHLPKSATATLPLVSQVEATPPTSPSGVAVAAKADEATDLPPTACLETGSSLPYHDSIIVTPATPMASPGHVAKPHEDLSDAIAEKQPLTAAIDSCDDDEQIHPPTGPLERKCSVYRMRRSDAFEYEPSAAMTGVRRQFKELQFNQQNQHYEPLISDDPHLIFKGFSSTTGRKIQICAYCEEGICVCEHIECAQGRAAWLERGRRCSVQETQQQQQATCHRRWVKRNRIQDASLGGSSDDEDFLGVLRGPSTFANAFLYVGLGTIALGLVIAFVGTGEKGFKTVELRLIGPSLIGLGFVCCMLRILFCICPSHCIANSKGVRKKNGNKVDADHTTSLLRGEIKRVSIARAPGQQSRYPGTHKRSNSKMLNEGMEALRQIATTSLFMQNEQKPATNRIVPIIKEPEAAAEKSEMGEKASLNAASNRDASVPEKFTNTYEIERTGTSTAVYTSAPTNPEDSKAYPVPAISGFNNKLSRQRVSVQQQNLAVSQLIGGQESVSSYDEACGQQMETSLIFVRNPNLDKEMRPPSNAAPTTSSRMNINDSSLVASTHLSPPEASSIPTVHAPNSLAAARQTGNSVNAPSTASTYAAALAASMSSRGNSDRTENLIRGPLAMPLSMLTASTSSYALPSSAPTTCLTRSITSSPLPAQPSTAPSLMSTTEISSSLNPQAIPGQVIDDLPIGTTVPSSHSSNCEQPPCTTNLKFPASSMLSSTYSASSSTLSPNSLVGSTSFTVPSLSTPISKYEPELLLSPAKLGQ
ncbi:uncharacterized protein LOC106082856 isoform X1 [Stomoxys calcitrans]|uniref:uncharacterized protein LOC106082856 isoform X1 n=1 Tax=Stomoxys calcitrans TaxID=35570 RepID=UPI0027E33EA9|nr:uncharacterized protein LOC106082856 isoform X1 [Stomoxys calcitrans]